MQRIRSRFLFICRQEPAMTVGKRVGLVASSKDTSEKQLEIRATRAHVYLKTRARGTGKRNVRVVRRGSGRRPEA